MFQVVSERNFGKWLLATREKERRGNQGVLFEQTHVIMATAAMITFVDDALAGFPPKFRHLCLGYSFDEDEDSSCWMEDHSNLRRSSPGPVLVADECQWVHQSRALVTVRRID